MMAAIFNFFLAIVAIIWKPGFKIGTCSEVTGTIVFTTFMRGILTDKVGLLFG